MLDGENEQFKQTDVAVLRSYYRRAQRRQQQRGEDDNLEELQGEVEKPLCCDHMIDLERTSQRCGNRFYTYNQLVAHKHLAHGFKTLMDHVVRTNQYPWCRTPGRRS